LTQAELKSKSFAEIQDLITQKFGGALQSNLSTTAGKMQVLANAAGEAQEKIGAGLVDALAKMSGGSTTTDAIKTIDNIANAINALSGAVGTVVGAFVKFYDIFNKVSTLGGLTGTNGTLFGNNKRPVKSASGAYVGGLSGTVGSALQKGRVMAEAKAEKDALARQKAITAELTKQSKLQKEKLALTQASAVLDQANKLFDQDAISLAAAMQGKLSEEDKVRVKLKQDILELEAAIQNNNIAAAASWSNAIVQDSQKLAILRGDMQSLNGIPNPFEAWLKSIEAMAAELSKLANVKPVDSYMPLSADYYVRGGFSLQAKNLLNGGPDGGTIININAAGSILTQQELTAMLREGLLNDSLSARQSVIDRQLGSFS
jgi:hypothetical protein